MLLSILDQDFLFPPENAPFACCHGSSLALLPGGDVLCAYFAGSKEGNEDTAIWLSRRSAAGWETPLRLFAEPGLPHWNPVLHSEAGRVWVFYKVGLTTQDWTSRSAVSEDGGRTWSDPRPLVTGDKLPRGPMKNKLLVLAGGEWLAPGSAEVGDNWDSFVDRSADQGRTWHRTPIPFDHCHGSSGPGEIWEGLGANALWQNDLENVFKWDGIIQPTLWEAPAGHLHMLLRSTRERIYRSDSGDNGRTWCAAYATALPNNNCGIDLAQLPDGRLVLAYNPIAANWGPRSPLSLTCSGDGGATWSAPFHLESGPGEYSYPAVIPGQNEVLLSYTWNRKTIAYRRLRIG